MHFMIFFYGLKDGNVNKDFKDRKSELKIKMLMLNIKSTKNLKTSQNRKKLVTNHEILKFKKKIDLLSVSDVFHFLLHF